MPRGRKPSSSSSSPSSSSAPAKEGKRRPVAAAATAVTTKSPRQASANVNANRGAAASKANAQFLRTDSRLCLVQASPDVNFWKGFSRPTLLVQALANIGTRVEADIGFLPDGSQPRYPFSALQVMRVMTAIQALVDAYELLRSMRKRDNAESSSQNNYNNNNNGNNTVSQRWMAIRKLVELSEAAVPMKRSILVSSFPSAADGENSTNVPPISLWALNERLHRVERLLQLRKCHLHIFSRLRQCKTKREVSTILFGSSVTEVDTIETISDISSLHQKEQCIIRGLLDQVNDIAPCSESWGESLVAPLRLVSGSYVIHKQSRSESLASLLRSAEFFGLPPFLRSIRIFNGRSRAFSLRASKTMHTSSDSSWQPHGFLFPSLGDLNPHYFEAPVTSHAQVVQEELIELTTQHCCFGAVVGEADQIASLICANVEYRRRLQMELSEVQTPRVKIEVENADEVAPTQQQQQQQTAEETRRGKRIGDGCGEDPLHAYAQSLLQVEREGGKNQPNVHWICSNRWGPTMTYYALLVTTVLPLSRDHMEEEEDEEERLRMKILGTPYYIAAVLELTRF